MTSKSSLFKQISFLKFIFALTLTLAPTLSFTAPIFPGYYKGQVDVVLAARPKIITQKTDCFILIESAEDSTLSSIPGFENLFHKLRFSGYMTLAHISKKDGDKDGFLWISTGPTTTILKEEKNKPGDYKYMILDPLEDPLVNNLKASFDDKYDFNVVSLSFYHEALRHFDVVHCKNLVPQTTTEEINAFLDVFAHKFNPTLIIKN
jgi:hypothetical protein